MAVNCNLRNCENSPKKKKAPKAPNTEFLHLSPSPEKLFLGTIFAIALIAIHCDGQILISFEMKVTIAVESRFKPSPSSPKKKIGGEGFNGSRTRGLWVRAAVLYHLSFEDPYTHVFTVTIQSYNTRGLEEF